VDGRGGDKKRNIKEKTIGGFIQVFLRLKAGKAMCLACEKRKLTQFVNKSWDTRQKGGGGGGPREGIPHQNRTSSGFVKKLWGVTCV